MKYISSRNIKKQVSAEEAIVEGLSTEDGGLFVPSEFPKITLDEIEALSNLTYAERAAEIISKYLGIDKKDLAEYTEKAYARFDGDPAPVVKVTDGIYFLELWHGPTHAFKDIALTLLPYLMTGSKKKLNKSKKTLILVATSGDTGKAALEGFKDVEGTDVIVFYPESGVSELQKLQMMTTTGKNVKVFGIKGNFDDAQNTVKKLFADKELADTLESFGYNLSSANSINFGRLVPQIVYYFSSYADLLDAKQIKKGEKINFCVPSGNFGNILAGYYAKNMGLPVNKLICASNKNNVLSDFINEGTYSVDREFYKTSSPSMDILISSNLERLLFELSDRDDKLTAERMRELKETKSYSISDKELNKIKSEFFAGFSDEESAKECLYDYYDDFGYVMDTHTAIAAEVLCEYQALTEDNTKTVIISTASPYKFVDDVLKALDEKPGKSAVKSLEKLEDISALPIPETLSELFTMQKLHTEVIDSCFAKEKVTEYCKNKEEI